MHKSLMDVELLRDAVRTGWPINWNKALDNLAAQIALDIGAALRTAQIVSEAGAPHILETMQERE